MRLLLAALVLLSSITRADELNGLKSCVTGAGDLDADGVPDIWIASRDGQTEVVWAVSGCDGSVLHVLRPGIRCSGFGAELARLGDLDRDGVDDLAVASRGAPAVASIFSGSTGHLLFELESGWSVAAAGDVDRDGVPDILLGCPDCGRNEDRGEATVCSGRDGSLLLRVVDATRETPFATQDTSRFGWRVESSAPLEHRWCFGTSVCSFGDVDSDGVLDFAVGAPASLSGPAGDGLVYLFSGRNGALLSSVRGDAWSASVGWSMRKAGDLDGDAREDLLVSGIHTLVLAISSKDFAPLFAVEHRAGWLDAFGSSLDRCDDIDGDGVGDWLVGANELEGSSFDVGFAHVRSGRDGHWIRNLFNSAQHGVDVASAGDVNGDGVDDHAIVIAGLHVARILSGRDGSLVREIDLAQLRAQSSDPDLLRPR